MNARDTDGTEAAFTHQACVYRSVDEFLAIAVPFVAGGLARDEPVLAVTMPTNVDSLGHALGRDADRIEFVDARAWYGHPATTLSAYDRYVAKHRGRPGHVRIIGEPVWQRGSDRQVMEWKRYESVLNVVFASSSAWIVCPYDSRVLDPAIVSDARQTHPALMSGPDTRPSPEFVDPADFFHTSERDPLPQPSPNAAVLPFAGDLRGLRQFVATQAARHGLTGDPGTLFVAAVSEVAIYMLSQGSGRATVRLWVRPGDVVCDIHDRAGRITDPFLGYRPPELAARPDDGLWLTRQVSELVETRSGDTGTTVRVHFSLPQTFA